MKVVLKVFLSRQMTLMLTNLVFSDKKKIFSLKKVVKDL